MGDDTTFGTGTTLWHRYRFETSIDRVFEAWTQPRALRLWWCPEGWHPTGIEVDLCDGGAWRIAMRRDGTSQHVAVHGRFLEVLPPTRLVYTWRWDGAFSGMPETRVTVDFRAVAGGTEIVLRQEALAMPLCTRHLAGWLAACRRLGGLIDSPALQSRLIETWRLGVIA